MINIIEFPESLYSRRLGIPDVGENVEGMELPHGGGTINGYNKLQTTIWYYLLKSKFHNSNRYACAYEPRDKHKNVYDCIICHFNYFICSFLSSFSRISVMYMSYLFKLPHSS